MMAGHERRIPCPRRPLGSHRAAPAKGTAEAQGRPSSRPRSRRPRRHRLRPADRLPVALLPKELGCGSGTTCWRRLRDWQEAGVWERLHDEALNWLGDEAAIDWSRASVDSLSVRAKRGASRPGRTRWTAASPAPSTTWSWIATASPWRSASRRPMPTTRPSCFPWLTPSRRSSVRGGRPGRPRKRPAKLHADKAYDSSELRRALRARGITPRIARRGIDSSERLGRHRWVVERSLPGCSVAVASACATSGERTCSKGCCTWPVR